MELFGGEHKDCPIGADAPAFPYTRGKKPISKSQSFALADFYRTGGDHKFLFS